MTWFKVDDKWHSHPKRHRAGIEAAGLWSVAGSWSADLLTDGFIPDYIARSLDPKFARHAKSLVDADLWYEEERDGQHGWQFHDWADYQPTKAVEEAKKAAWRERQKRAREAGKKRAEAAHAKEGSDLDAGVTTDAVTRDSPVTSRVTHSERHAPVTESRPVPSRPVPTAYQLATQVGGDAPADDPPPELDDDPPDPRPDPPPDTTHTLIAEWLDHCAERPPKGVIGQLSREIKKLLDEKIPPPVVRAGVVAWHQKNLHPSTLASVVHETRQTANGHRRPSTADKRVMDGMALAASFAAEDEHAVAAQQTLALPTRRELT